jgi:polyadenylate-binding protein 2
MKVSSSNPLDKEIRSIYIKNLDYDTTPEEIEEHFKICGVVNKVSLVCDKYTGASKG